MVAKADKSLGQIAYEAFAKCTMLARVSWQDLPYEAQKPWEAAADAVFIEGQVRNWEEE